jgi:hypothetical protein
LFVAVVAGVAAAASKSKKCDQHFHFLIFSRYFSCVFLLFSH